MPSAGWSPPVSPPPWRSSSSPPPRRNRASRLGQLTLHADRGSSMTSKPVAFLLADLGVIQSHSRPHVSQRQPVLRGAVQSPEIPARVPSRFTSIEAAPAHCQAFFPWYNTQHRSPGGLSQERCFRRGWLVGLGGRPAVTERDGEGVDHGLPAHRPPGAAGPGRVQAAGHKIQAFQCGLLAGKVAPGPDCRR